VRAVHGLQVLVRVPVRVEYDDRVGLLQVQAQAARPRAQQEAEDVASGAVEALEHLAALVGLGASVQAQVLDVLQVEVVLHDGHETCHLAEHEDSVAGLLQLGQDAVEELELAAGSVDVRARDHAARVAHVDC